MCMICAEEAARLQLAYTLLLRDDIGSFKTTMAASVRVVGTDSLLFNAEDITGASTPTVSSRRQDSRVRRGTNYFNIVSETWGCSHIIYEEA